MQDAQLWRINALLELLLCGDFYVYEVLFATAFHHVIEIMSYEKKFYKNHRGMKFES